ncbi:MAG: hypothetical protein ING19_08860 [Azospirillum sp.]|nr:hypothetical protein [Azospirillum sp.]
MTALVKLRLYVTETETLGEIDREAGHIDGVLSAFAMNPFPGAVSAGAR